jgi:hypothetical protein
VQHLKQNHLNVNLTTTQLSTQQQVDKYCHAEVDIEQETEIGPIWVVAKVLGTLSLQCGEIPRTIL